MPYPRPPALACALLWGASVAAALPAADAQIHRCTTADGGTMYTDRSCDSVGAMEAPVRADGPGVGAGSSYRGGCARSIPDLVFEVSAAIDAGDTNRLARSYHWVGMSTRSGYAVLERLDAIARRPLFDITALEAAPEPGPGPALPPAMPMPAAATTADPQPAALEPVRRRYRPVALRIDQALSDGVTPSSTTFGLRRHMDCWWITL